MWRILIVLAALLAGPVRGAEPAPVSLAPGEAVVLRVSRDGNVKFVRREAAPPLTAFDRFNFTRLAGEAVPPDAKVLPGHVIMKGEGPPAPALARGVVRLSLHQIPGKSPRDTLLIVENGYGDALRYRAVMTVAGRSSPPMSAWSSLASAPTSTGPTPSTGSSCRACGSSGTSRRGG